MRKIAAVLLLMGLSSFAVAQSFDLKGDSLGMSLESFKKRHWRMPKGQRYPAPACTDNFSMSTTKSVDEVLRSGEYLLEGRVVCELGLPGEDHSDTIAGETLKSLQYEFLDASLFRIVAVFDRKSFESIRLAAVQKYGVPSSTSKQAAQNMFGATFSGDCVLWTKGTHTVALIERVGDIETSALMIVDTSKSSILKRRQVKNPKDI